MNMRQRLLPSGVLLILVTVVTLTYMPGHMSADTLYQIDQVDAGVFDDMHAPVLLSLWSIVWNLYAATWYVLLATVLLFVVSAYCLLRSGLGRTVSALLTVAITVSPVLLGYLGVLSRDTWFTVLTLGSFAALARATGWSGRAQTYAVAGALLLSWMAMATRQNGFPVTLVLVWAALALLAQTGPRWAWARSPLRRAAAALVVMLAMMGTQALYASGVLSVKRTHPEQATLLYDTIGMSLREGRVLLPQTVYPGSDLAPLAQRATTTSIGAAVYGADRVIPFPVPGDEYQALRSSWFNAVRKHPLTYLDTRWDLWLEQIGWTNNVQWIQHPQIDSNRWGYRATVPSLERLANHYVAWFAQSANLQGGIAFEVWLYLLIDGYALFYFRRKPHRRVLAALAAGALVYEATLFFGAASSEYRFSLLAVASALVLSCVAAGDGMRTLNARRTRLSCLNGSAVRGAPATGVELRLEEFDTALE